MSWRRLVTWRALIVEALLGLWAAIGIAWGPRAALICAFFAIIPCLVAVWSVLAGRFGQDLGGWYYERQLDQRRSGRRRRSRDND